jgi:uncharacterized protein
MKVYYLDSSAWVKRYLTELGSPWVQRLFAQKEPLACCPLGYTEVAAAIARQQGVQKISPDRLRILRRDVLADWKEMLQAPLDSAVLALATEFAWDLKLRGADAIHLAAAHSLQQSLAAHSLSLTLVTADLELLAAAQQRQISVLHPVTASD